MTDRAARAAEGSCVCGAVKYSITPPYLAFQYCHCSRCRKASGSAHAANLFVPAAQLRFSDGESLVRRFELPDARYWSHTFCERCGSALPWLTRTGKAYVVPAGTLDGDPGVRPERSIFHASRSPWFVEPGAIPAFDEAAPR